MKVNEMFKKSTKHEITKFIHETGKQMQLLTLQFASIGSLPPSSKHFCDTIFKLSPLDS